MRNTCLSTWRWQHCALCAGPLLGRSNVYCNLGNKALTAVWSQNDCPKSIYMCSSLWNVSGFRHTVSRVAKPSQPKKTFWDRMLIFQLGNWNKHIFSTWSYKKSTATQRHHLNNISQSHTKQWTSQSAFTTSCCPALQLFNIRTVLFGSPTLDITLPDNVSNPCSYSVSNNTKRVLSWTLNKWSTVLHEHRQLKLRWAVGLFLMIISSYFSNCSF